MKQPLFVVAILLIIIGIGGLGHGGYRRYHHHDRSIHLGPLTIEREEHHSAPPVLGTVALLVGAGLLVWHLNGRPALKA